jgi:hypothetical protein
MSHPCVAARAEIAISAPMRLEAGASRVRSSVRAFQIASAA